MKQQGKQNGYPRREFLRRSAVTGVGAMAALSLPGGSGAVAAQPQQESPKQKGYHLTRHIVDYYKTAAE